MYKKAKRNILEWALLLLLYKTIINETSLIEKIV